MEIHAPGKHVQSLPDILLHLAIVTIGILIALGLEQGVEWVHHRELVAEARENILNEIRSDRKEMDTHMARLRRHRAGAVEAFEFVTDLFDRGKSDRHNLSLTMSTARLRSTSWSSAQTVGALALMPYADVEKYAALYSRQHEYLLAYNRTEDAGVAAYGVFSRHNNFEKLSHSELEAERARPMNMISALTVEMQFAQVLGRAYDALLSGKPVATPAVPASAVPRKQE